jgi:hypothetical protein
MTGPPTLTDLMTDPGELDVSCLGCHHNTTMPVAALLPRYPAETPFSGGLERVSLFGLGPQADRRSALLGGPPSGRADNPAVAARDFP